MKAKERIFLQFFFHQVRAFYRSCNGRASCNCAVAVRAGDDVIIIDKCGPEATTDQFYPMTVKMFLRGSLTPGLRILSQYEGREYKVKKQKTLLKYVNGYPLVVPHFLTFRYTLLIVIINQNHKTEKTNIKKKTESFPGLYFFCMFAFITKILPVHQSYCEIQFVFCFSFFGPFF